MRGTVNTFFRGSIPLDAFNIILFNIKLILIIIILIKRDKELLKVDINEHVEIGKQSPLKQEWK